MAPSTPTPASDRATSFNFLGLPAEIRNQIYELVYPAKLCNSIYKLKDPQKYRLIIADPPFALVFAWKQIYDEAFAMYLVELQRAMVLRLRLARLRNLVLEFVS
ncbi:hypothetical protein EJ08DRAFT_698117 [Tothia fuscella]|uniref:Uncharacterized protein n=1 Tax=Tothia fuscella TaxID=1048955 RepID=A0A9P4TXH3_9PEZI|nr:hypothetical protein EJ08DRAFT_698117 [Tothia fuscella]